MSIFDEILLLVDDQPGLNIENLADLLPRYTRQILASTIGRLVNRHWLARNDADSILTITPTGNNYISSILIAIRRSEQDWDGSWFCVVATLPETQRRERDLLRHYLHDHGFGRWIDGFWISTWPRQDEVGQVMRRLGIGSSVFMFGSKPFGQASNQMVVKSAWNWPEVNRRLQAYRAEIPVLLAEMEELQKDSNNPVAQNRLRHAAKCFVFKYGELLTEDPNLPLSIVPEPEPYLEIQKIYQQVRAYCY